MQPIERLSKNAREALIAVERSSTIEVDWLVESLGLRKGGASGLRGARKAAPDNDKSQSPSVSRNNAALSHRRYHDVKRIIDGAGAILITLALAPVLVVVSVFVAIDVGFPLVFWQLRPGRHGRRFKLFKFRTMRPVHDVHGNRISDQLRSSNIGNLLRRSRLDELPQLYNILLGEMSFVGPRPLLPVDQPQWQNSRLVVRPGLTGWAQINGGRDISPEDKAALDIWYIVNASLWLDISILLRTLVMLVAGEQVNRSAVQAAQSTLEKMETKWAAGGIVMSARSAQEAP
jgi:lipopolysaccharide/colanic/teichoic acid biosynthesis glycosyltransferase